MRRTFLTLLLSRAVAFTTSFGPLRVTVFSPTTVRLQEASRFSGAHEDRPSLAAINATSNFDGATASVSGDTLTVSTSALTISYTHAGGNSTPAPISSFCSLARAADIVDGDRVAALPDGAVTASMADCCSLCDSIDACNAWVFAPVAAARSARELRDPPGTNCWIMQGVTALRTDEHRVAGALLPFENDTLTATFALGGSTGSWNAAMRSTDDAGQLKGVWHGNDCYAVPAECIPDYQNDQRAGLVSRSGWAVLDDTAAARRVPNDPSSPSPLSSWFANASAATRPTADWYLFAPGINYSAAVRDYAAIGGAPALPPRSVFGVWWSHWQAFNESFFLSDILEHYAALSLPLDHINLDVDWHTQNESIGATPCYSYGGWTVNSLLFPDWPGFLRELRDGTNPTGHALRLMLNLHPQGGYDACQKYYPDFAALVNSSTAPGAPIVPCTTGNQRIANAIFEAYMDRAELADVDGWWVDYDGDECFGSPTASTSASYPGMAWSNEVYGVHNALRGRRPLVLARSGGLGAHRDAISFAGDANQHREVLRWELWVTPRAANALHHTWSHDIGGFMCQDLNQSECSGDPLLDSNGLLYLRWLQAAVTLPIFRTHASHWDIANMERRIWRFPSFFDAMAEAMRLRSALLPYTYTEAREATLTGLGYMRPLYFEWPASEEAYAPLDSNVSTQYLFGSAILSSPLWETNATVSVNGVRGGFKSTWLPPGVSWSTWNASEILSGGQIITRFYALNDTPLFVRAGSVIPLQTYASVAHPAADPLVVAAFPFAGASGSSAYDLFEDDGASPSADHTITRLSAAVTSTARAITSVISVAAAQGAWAGAPASRALQVHMRGYGAARGAPTVTANGAPVAPGVPGCTACFYIVPAAAHNLTVPEGTLVIAPSGRFSTAADAVIIVTSSHTSP
jgi:hypothetical protein